MNNNKNMGPAVDLKDIPERLKNDIDARGHFKLTDEQMELQSVIDNAFKEMRLQDGTMALGYQRAWLRKDIEAFIAKKGGFVSTEPVITKDLLTEKEKFDFIIEKVMYDMWRIRKIAGGNPFKSWMEAERKFRLLLDGFGQALPNEVKTELLITEISSIILAMLGFGKWEKESGK